MYPVMKDSNGRPMAFPYLREEPVWGVGERALDIEGGDDHLVGVHVQYGVLEEDGPVGALPAMAPHMLAGTWAKTAGAMRPRMSVHTSLTSVVAQTMGR